MQILSVTLRNFKSHSDRQFSFEVGTNAICGENGAGKTSILEAIAWTLFDYTPYTVEDMIREGASSAEVSVSFVSALENRTYEVRRSTASGYRLYDPQIDRRLEPEKKADVLRWLRQHLGVPPGTNLPKLFANTIGVPQGTFTADFLKTAQDRKRIFDSILKVEEYQGVYKDLLGLQKYSEQQVTASEHQIELCTVELREWESLEQQQRELQSAIERDTQRLGDVDTKLAQIGESIANLDTTAQQLSELDRQLQAVDRSRQLKQQELERWQADVEAAQQAWETVEASREGYTAFLAAEATLKQLEQQRRQRQLWQERRQQLLESTRDREQQRAQILQRLELLAQADLQLTNLQPLVERQQVLDAEQKQLAVQSVRLQELQHEQSLRQTQLEAQQQHCQQTKEAFQAAQAAYQQQEADRLSYDRVRQAEATLEQLEGQQQQRQAAMQHHTELIRILNRYQVEQATLQEQQQRSQQLDRDITSLKAQLTRQEALESQRSDLEAQTRQFQTMRLQLQQRLEEEESIRQTIVPQQANIDRCRALTAEVDRMPHIREQIERLSTQLARISAARAFQQDLDGIYQSGTQNLSDYRQQSKQMLHELQANPQLSSILEGVSPLLHQGHRISQELLSQIAEILQDLAQQVDVPKLKSQLQQWEAQLQEGLLAQTQLSELPGLEAELQKTQQKLQVLQEEIADLNWQLEAETTCNQQREDVGFQLQELGDPRTRLSLLNRERQTYANSQQKWQRVCTAIERQQQQLQKVEDDLATSANLPNLIATEQRQRQQHLQAYRRFIKQEDLANSFPQLQKEHSAACQKLEELRAHLAEQQTLWEELVRQQGTLDALQQRQQAIGLELEELQNPRQQVAHLQKDLEARPHWQEQLQQLEVSSQDDRQQLDDIQAQLESTANVDRKFMNCQSERDRHREAFQTYVAHQGLAEQCDRRRQELQQVQTLLEQIDKQHQELLQHQQPLLAEFDQQKYDQLKLTQAEALTHQTQLRVQIQTAQPQLESVEGKLASLEEVRQRVTDLQQEKKQRERLRRFVKYVRTVFRDAGPRITELYQSSVNREADRLFREILNRPTVSLQWEANYDIVVQEGGSRKRKFASLSGGEQMAAALAVRLALLRALADIDIAFFDEPTTNMDRPRRERLAEAISNIKSFKQLFVISHDDTFANITENIIWVERGG